MRRVVSAHAAERRRVSTLAMCAEVHVANLDREANRLSEDGRRELAMLRRDVAEIARSLGPASVAGGPFESARETR